MNNGSSLTSNLTGITLPDIYIIPNQGKVGMIENAVNSSILNNKKLTWESPELDTPELIYERLWEIGLDDGSGYFSIQNPMSGKFLIADNTGTATLRGIYIPKT